MHNVLEHIKNAKDWQLEQTLEFFKTLHFHKNTLVKNVASTMTNHCSMELHKRTQHDKEINRNKTEKDSQNFTKDGSS